MILLSDENLGSMVVNRDDHVKEMMEQCLSNRGIHAIITKEEAAVCSGLCQMLIN